MVSLAFEAGVWRFRMLFDLAKSEEVVAWADARICDLSEPPEELIELSLFNSSDSLYRNLFKLSEGQPDFEVCREALKSLEQIEELSYDQQRTIAYTMDEFAWEDCDWRGWSSFFVTCWHYWDLYTLEPPQHEPQLSGEEFIQAVRLFAQGEECPEAYRSNVEPVAVSESKRPSSVNQPKMHWSDTVILVCQIVFGIAGLAGVIVVSMINR